MFAYLRLQLLDSQTYPHLFRALYALLMILPQSTAFTTLRKRLSCVSAGPLQISESEQSVPKSKLNMKSLVDTFVDVQEKQLAFREAVRQEKNNRILMEQTRQGKKLMEIIRKKGQIGLK